MTQSTLFQTFETLHTPSNPLILYNVWDAGTAKAACEAGARAIATGSWSVAAAQGYADGENIPLAVLVQIVTRIVDSVDVPVSVDFECGYSDDLGQLSDNFKAIMDTGAVGVNFEDQIIGQSGIRTPDDQARRIETLANTASQSGVKMFVNARTDMFLQESDASKHETLMQVCLDRDAQYRAAGANGFFVPGLSDGTLISQLTQTADLPINVMASGTAADMSHLAECGVARISQGPHPYRAFIETFKTAAALSLGTT